MHFQYLIEDQSSALLIHEIMFKLMEKYTDITYDCKAFKGIGGFTKKNTVKETKTGKLLNDLATYLRGFNKSLSGIPAVIVVVLDNDDNNTEELMDNGFASIAEKLVEAKLGLDNTQMIDTNKVREALRETQIVEEEPNPEFDEMYRKTFGVDTVSVRREKELENLEKEKLNASKDFSYATENMNVFDESEECPEIPYKFLGIAFSTYIIIEIKNEMYIIDQHAAHERIMYEKVKENYYSEGEKEEQSLLLPDVISLTHKEMIIAKENVEMFNRAGFSFEEFGENTIKLMSVPSMCEDMNTKQLFLDILDEIDTVAVTAETSKPGSSDEDIAAFDGTTVIGAKYFISVFYLRSLQRDRGILP